MPNYIYKAIDDLGKIYTKSINSDSIQEAIKIIKSKNLMIVDIKKSNIMTMDIKDLNIFKPEINTKDLSIFFRQFSVLIESGVNIGNAVDILRYQVQGYKFRNTIQYIYESIQKGNSLSESIKQCTKFPEFVVNMIVAGEASGNLTLILKSLSEQYSKDIFIQRKIKSAMIYPTIVVILMICIVMAILVFVIPSYMNMFQEMDANLPTITLILISISNILARKWIIIFIFIVIFCIISKIFFNTPKGKHILDNSMLKLPLLKNIIVKISTARFSRITGMMLNSGVSIIESLEIVKQTITNTKINMALEHASKEVEQGISFSEAIKELEIFPYMLESMIDIGENTSQLGNMLYKTADFYEQEIILDIEQLTKFIEPFITIIIGLIMAFVMLAIVMPIFSLASQM